MLCHADADVITYNWRDTQPHPFPDFSINRKCRNINDLIAFRDERRVDMGKYEAMTKPKDIRPLPMELGYYPMVWNASLHITPTDSSKWALLKAFHSSALIIASCIPMVRVLRHYQRPTGLADQAMSRIGVRTYFVY